MPEVVTIGITSYNQLDFIKEAVESCRMQDYTSLYIFVADDCSTVRTDEVMKQYRGDSRIRYYRNEVNQGRVGNYRKMLYEYAGNTDWYLNLDGDDYLTDPGFISYAMHMISIANDPGIVFFQGNHDAEVLNKVFPDAQRLDKDSILINGKDFFLRFHQFRNFTHMATLYHARMARELNFYNSNCFFSDFHSLSRLSLHGKVILSIKKAGVWREHPLNESRGLNENNFGNELTALNDIAEYGRNYFSEKEINKWHKKMREHYYRVLFYEMGRNRPSREALSYIIKHFRLNYTCFASMGKISLKLLGILRN